MAIKHQDLNERRRKAYRKSSEHEAFLEQFNDTLVSLEKAGYRNINPAHPFLFIIGLPRSGTTLLSQLVAHCLDVGYVNNLAARFWKAPVTGIRFADSILDADGLRTFKSHYGATEELADIHEFGYFWRNWLKKDSFENIKNARQIEDEIDWSGLRKTLANMQDYFGRPMVFKNIFGSYHIPRLNELLDQTLWIYIERDPLDTAVSILKAREKYFDDPNTWWSYVPPEYEQIIDKDYRYQIAGQVYYLGEFYRGEMSRLEPSGRGITISYRELSERPGGVLDTVRERVQSLYKSEISRVQKPPSSFDYRTYDDFPEEKDRFKKLLNSFQ